LAASTAAFAFMAGKRSGQLLQEGTAEPQRQAAGYPLTTAGPASVSLSTGHPE